MRRFGGSFQARNDFARRESPHCQGYSQPSQEWLNAYVMSMVEWLAISVALLLFLSGAEAVLLDEGSSPLVLAFYYNWFDENTWTPEKVSDFPLTLYHSRDRETVVRHIAQAQEASIDAFVVGWYGPRVESNQTETNLTLMLEPDRWSDIFADHPDGLFLNYEEDTLVPRLFHFLLAAPAVAGAFVIAYATFMKNKTDEAYWTWAGRYGALWFIGPTVIQLAVGPLFLLLLPEAVRDPFIGDDAGRTTLLFAGVGAALVALLWMAMALLLRNPLWPGLVGSVALITTIQPTASRSKKAHPELVLEESRVE